MVAIPSMFGYNWLVHNLRVAPWKWIICSELSAKIEAEYLQEVPVNAQEPQAVMEKQSAEPELDHSNPGPTSQTATQA